MGHRLRISHSLGAFPRPGGGISALFVVFRITNTGREDAGISNLSVAPKTGGEPSTSVREGDPTLPFTLQPGESARFWVRARGLAEQLEDAGHAGGRVRVVISATDDLGGIHRETFGLRVDEYLRLKDE